MPLRFLCLHGAGSSAAILRMQLGSLARNLSKDNSAEFVYIDGQLPCGPGPGMDSFFEPPFYSFYNWPRGITAEDDASVQEAYELIYEVIEEEGPFDGLLGFSQGATLAFGFLTNHAKTRPWEPIEKLVRCAVFICTLPPFTQSEDGKLIYDDDLHGHLDIPSVVVAGKEDFVYEHTLRLAELCTPGPSKLVVHNKGHEIPNDLKVTAEMAEAVRSLARHTLVF